MSARGRHVLVVTAGESGGLLEAIQGRRLALFGTDFLVVDVDLAERARRRVGLPIVPLADAA